MIKNISVGMNLHNSSSKAYPIKNLEYNLDLCVSLGVDCIRYNTASVLEERRQEAVKVAKACHKRDMKFMLVMDDRRYLNDDIEDMEAFYEDHMRTVGKAYGNNVDIYQIFNEIDVAAMHGDIANIILPGKDGRELGEYDYLIVEKAIKAMKGAIRGLKSVNLNAVICANFAWWHTAVIYEMRKHGIHFDIIGLDWYSDCEDVSDIRKLIAELEVTIPESKFIITETNYWMHPMKRDPLEKQESIKDKKLRNINQAEWVCGFIDKLVEMNNPKLIGIQFYELMDEPIFEIERGSYHGESHFGFIECDVNGENYVFKPVFTALKRKIEEYKNQSI